MTAAPVGFHCPEDIAAASVTAPRTTFGGTVSNKTPVTYALIGICVGLYGVVGVLGMLGGTNRWSMFPPAIALQDQWFRLVSSMFMHAGVLHILFNMYVLAMFGPSLERVLGRSRFLALYLLAGLGGSVASFLYSPIMISSVGASGAIFGLLAATVVVGRAMGQDMTQVLVLFGINIAIGFVISGIDWRAHIGGSLVGAAVAFILARRGRTDAERRRRSIIQLVGCLGVLAILVGLSIYRAQEIENGVSTVTRQSASEVVR